MFKSKFVMYFHAELMWERVFFEKFEIKIFRILIFGPNRRNPNFAQNLELVDFDQKSGFKKF